MCNSLCDTEKSGESVQHEDAPSVTNENVVECADGESTLEENNQLAEDDSQKESTLNIIDPEKVDGIFSKLESLESLFSRRLSYDADKERILDKLHAELQDYKSDLYFKLMRPIFHDITVVLDDIRKIRLSTDKENKSDTDPLLESIAESLVFLLDKYEVLPFTSSTNSKFDAVRQRMVRTELTDDASLAGLIAESISAGFMQKEHLVSPEKVTVYKKEEK